MADNYATSIPVNGFYIRVSNKWIGYDPGSGYPYETEEFSYAHKYSTFEDAYDALRFGLSNALRFGLSNALIVQATSLNVTVMARSMEGISNYKKELAALKKKYEVKD